MLDIGCGIGDVLMNANFQRKLGLDHKKNVINALRFRSRLCFRKGYIEARVFVFNEEPIEGLFDAVVICNWIHNIDPKILRLNFELIFENNLNAGGALYFDIVQGKSYPYLHDEKYLLKNLFCEIRLIGEYQDGVKDGGTRRLFCITKLVN
jgi:SAM-dependent methyltransferase